MSTKTKMFPNGFFSSTQYIIQKFNTFNPGANLFYTSNGNVIPYAVMWKCVSDGIIKNLHRATVSNASFGSIRHQFIQSYDQFEFLLSSTRFQENGLTYESANQGKKFKLFTIVREPLDRFISGFTESIFRTFKHKKYFQSGSNSTLQTTNVSAIKEFINHFLAYKDPLLMMGHFFPMSGVLFQYPVHILGHVKSFQQDWEDIIKPAYNITIPFMDILGLHPTSVHHPKIAGLYECVIYSCY